jgi:hypothetical protein
MPSITPLIIPVCPQVGPDDHHHGGLRPQPELVPRQGTDFINLHLDRTLHILLNFYPLILDLITL